MGMTVKSLKPGSIALCAVSAGAAAVVVTAPIAGADPILPMAGNGPASDAIQQLQSAGYNVSINWLEDRPNVPLTECKVTGIWGLRGTTTSTDVMMMPDGTSRIRHRLRRRSLPKREIVCPRPETCVAAELTVVAPVVRFRDTTQSQTGPVQLKPPSALPSESPERSRGLRCCGLQGF